MKKHLLLTALCLITGSLSAIAQNDFDWRGATVYFVITDRFCDGDTANNCNYGRKIDYGSERLNAATFHGGDFKGLLQKTKEGYFSDLGVDVIWMTDVYEQIHGWMSGSGSINDFPHYGYHGYYPLDYTQIDKNYGTANEFRELVDTLHSQGIRVMLGANLNDPGYPTLLDAVQFGFADTGLSEEEAAEHIREWSYDKFFEERAGWDGWYNRDWIRMPDENWDESNPLEATLYGMPDYKDENRNQVNIPEFLKRKWSAERNANDAWVNPSAVKLRTDRNCDPLQYVTAWIASWVEEFGIDGFRCDIVENVRIGRWKELYEACNQALQNWREKHKGMPASDWHDKFYMTGDFDGASIDYKPEYADAGFSSLVNFYFPKRGDLDAIVYTWQAYADSLQAHHDWHPFSYLNNSYHRDIDTDNIIECATTLLMAPGAAQLFYGDETGRGLSEARFNVDSNQAFRSDMNWDSIDSKVLTHFQKLGRIRKNNPVISTGKQMFIDSHTCLRYDDQDRVFIRLRPKPDEAIRLNGIFEDGSRVCELYTGQCATVKDGEVKFGAYENEIAIISEVKMPFNNMR